MEVMKLSIDFISKRGTCEKGGPWATLEPPPRPVHDVQILRSSWQLLM